MEVSAIKEEVVYFRDLKVKEENSSSVVYDVEVTSKVDIKPKNEVPTQSTPIFVTSKRIQSATDINVSSDQDPLIDELEPASTNTSDRESESDSNDETAQHIPQSSKVNSTRSNRNVSKMKKGLVKNPTIQLLQCTLCPRSFPTVGLLITHAQTKHAKIKNLSGDEDETLTHCPLCIRTLKSDSLRRHFLSFHINNKPIQCSLCLESSNEIKTFPTETLLKKHIRWVHDPARYKFQCDICSYKCQNLSFYKRHKVTHTEKRNKCEYCSKTYRKKEVLLKHIIAIHKEYTDRHETFKCEDCEQLFCSQKELNGHVMQTHAVDTVQCKICLKKFMEEGELRKHLDVAHYENRTWLVCDVCSKAFKNNTNLVEHLEVEHKRFFKCRKCFKSFIGKEEYESHSSETLDEKGINVEKPQLQCKICLVFLNSECSFNTHKNTHVKTGEIGSKNIFQLQPRVEQECPLKCDFCPKTFQQKSLVLKHAMKCHPNEKWKCKSCEKSFQLKYQLIEHEMVHFADKPFHCKVCKKCFTSLPQLKVHETIHKERKKYECSHCEKSYNNMTNLKYHIAIRHIGEERFKCDICKKSFPYKALFVLHSLVHTDKRPFSCSICSSSFKCAKHLEHHQQRVHFDNPKYKCKKGTSYPTRLGPHLKYFQHLVFVCCVEKCEFETMDEKEVAIHNAKHGLPQLILSRKVPCPLIKTSDSSTLTPSQKFKKRTVQPRFKCKHCFKLFTLSGSLASHVTKFHTGRKFRKVTQGPVHHGPKSVYAQNLVFLCGVKECGFETEDNKEVAIHYEKHNLPKVNVPRLLDDPSGQVFLSKSTPINKHAIQTRYKCTQCLKDFSMPEGLRNHRSIKHNGEKTKSEKRISKVLSSDKDER